MKDINKIDDFVYDALSDYAGEPSPQVITQIRKKMYFSNLATRFKYMFFNLTTLISVISVSAIIILAVTYLPVENSTDNKVAVAENTAADAKIPVNNEITSSELNAQTTNNENPADNAINSLNQSEDKSTENSDNYKSAASEKQNQTTKPIDKKEALTSNNTKPAKKDKTSVANNKTANNKPEEEKQNLSAKENPTVNKAFDGNQNSAEKTNPSDQEINYLPVRKEESVVLNQGYQTTPEIKAAEIPVDYNKESVPDKSEQVVAETPVVKEIPVETDKTKENSTKPLKTNTPDSVSGGKNNDYAKKASFSLDGYFAYGGGSNTFSGSQTQSLLAKETTGKPLMMTGGLSANYHFKNMTVSGGLGYSIVKEDFSFSKNELSLDTSYTTETIDIGYFDIDSAIIGYDIDSSFVVIDSSGVWEIDSVPVWETDSVWVPVDSTYTVMDIDSLINTLIFNARNRYTYLEIPIVFGYEFEKNKLTFPVKIGLITGIFLNAQGKGIDFMDENGVVDLKNLPFMKINLTGYLSAGVNYRLSNNYCIFAEGYMRKKLNSDYEKTYNISKKTNFFGLKAGFRYNF
ncbi:MAG: hypothetical protein A2W91_00600 [Bacteroidetes bacterium GWF2_38_335]|nr:MAG: hypothetical protein A2W91_00600 [Bacteroidetes bacterium GWF2_38_335]OFY78332.1 MAG: hypothetical protein A2281_03980 [Bacteroidetes bacterium RIFOXYA12_FULL_38_20]HBS87472.1 hypothetical protein [Bacteroidales bacterium]